MNKLLLILLCLFASISHAEMDKNSKYRENQVKALFVYNFANFVEWPNEAFPSRQAPLKLCLYGSVPFAIFLEFVNGTMIRDRRLEVLNTNNIKDIERGCHILFVGEDQKKKLPTLFKQIQHIFVLSVGESEGFATKGGVISIMRTSDQMQFDINLNQAIANGLYINSDLLSLARVVRGNSANKKK